MNDDLNRQPPTRPRPIASTDDLPGGRQSLPPRAPRVPDTASRSDALQDAAADGPSRRDCLVALGAGLMVAIGTGEADAQQRGSGRRGGNDERGGDNRGPSLAARLHIAADGTVTLMTGKVECGQGARAQLTQAIAEELGADPQQIRVIMGDTELCPDDGPTAGSRTTPNTVPAVRRAGAAARAALLARAAERLNVEPNELGLLDGTFRHAASDRRVGFGELVGGDWSTFAADRRADGVELRPVARWTVLGSSLNRPNGADIVLGKHAYPSDITRPEMLHGVVLRSPRANETLEAVDLNAAPKDARVTIVRDGDFVGAAAPRASLARAAIAAIEPTARWRPGKPRIDTPDLFEHLRRTAKDPSELIDVHADAGDGTLAREYQVAYVQHVPLEPRAAVAEWADGKLTVWTATQIPTRVRGELAGAFDLPADRVRVIVPDFGGGFGGKHTGECAVEAARLAKAAGRPVSLRWTREEEFAYAAFRPAALIQASATLGDRDDAFAAWSFVNVNSGGSGLRSPYRTAGEPRERFIESTAPPLRHGSYRALASTANHFARECFIDELAGQAGVDPLTFRLTRLAEQRQIDALRAAADRFGWAERLKRPQDPTRGIGLACGTEKGSFVACCVEIAIDPATREIRPIEIVQSFECGKIQNPNGLQAQVLGAILQGLGPALWERVELADGRVTTRGLKQYRVPHFSDVPPKVELVLMDRPDLDSVGGSETPIIVVAPAIANAVWQATGQRVREMPIRL